MFDDVEDIYKNTTFFDLYIDPVIQSKRVENFSKIYNKNKDFFGPRILDLCCGSGAFSIFLAKKGHKVLGIDISKEMIEKANELKQNLDNVEFVCANVLEYSFRESFDTIICIGGSLAHFSPDDLVRLIKNVFNRANKILIGQIDRIYLCLNVFNKPNVIRFGDKITINIPGEYSSDDYIVLNLLTIDGNKIIPVSTKLYLYNPGILKALMELGGFRLKKTIQSQKSYYWHFFEKYR